MQTMHCITLLTVPRNFQCVTKVVNLAINCSLPNHKSFNATNVAFTPSHCYPLLHYIAVLQTNYILSMYGNLTVLNCYLPDYDTPTINGTGITANNSYIPQTVQREGRMLFCLGNITNLLDVTPRNPMPHPLSPLPIPLCVI